MTIRCRFAPSPTGHVHIGNMRAAIYNWLYARHTGGAFLLRIEDTDRERSTPEAVQTVLDAMDWLGLEADEEPMYQSTRREAHLAAAEQLLSADLAYRLDKGETGRGEAVLFRMPHENVRFRDAIKGELEKGADDMKDFVIVRSDGSPVFHLANVVDDIEMGVTHIIRGDDHVENSYRHIALFQALGAKPPTYAHMPMIVNAQGRPYSKRDGAAFVGDFRSEGYLSEALFNYLVLLGWSPGDDREVMSRKEMILDFTLERVQSKPAQFDMKKFQWMNSVYMQQESDEEWMRRFRDAFPSAADDVYLRKVIELMKPRIKMWSEVASAVYFFDDEFPFDEKAVNKRLRKPESAKWLELAREAFASSDTFQAAELEQALRETAERNGLKPADLIHPVRVAVSGQAGGPSLFEMLETIGRERVLQRISAAS